jgi:hypothetical protein
LSVDISLVAFLEKADPIASVRQAASRQFVLSAQAWWKITSGATKTVQLQATTGVPALDLGQESSVIHDAICK